MRRISGPTAAAALTTTKEQQREELERLTADYDGPIIREARDQRVQMVCSQCRARRMVSGLAFAVFCRRCNEPMRPWWQA
jgi:hypothetical protein